MINLIYHGLRWCQGALPLPPGDGLDLHVPQHLGASSLSQGDLVAGLHQVMRHHVRDHRIQGIVRVAAKETWKVIWQVIGLVMALVYDAIGCYKPKGLC